jgi:hypothetical protein
LEYYFECVLADVCVLTHGFIFVRSQVTFAEVACTGPGSYAAGRVAWEKHLSYGEVQRFVDIRFIDDGWLSNQPW